MDSDAANAQRDHALSLLVVEDSRTQAEYLKKILERADYQVSIAADGRQAIQAIGMDPPSLVLTDIIMPEMDGYAVCRWIKKNPGTSHIPVILVTQLCDPVDVMKGLEAGADNFIIKPFEPDCVLSRIERTLHENTPFSGPSELEAISVMAGDGSHTISASRKQVLNILLSTYETAVKKNAELEKAQDKLFFLNEQLETAIQDLKATNTNLSEEVAERKTISLALSNANNKLQLMASITRHDLLNQLHSIQGYLDLAVADQTVSPEKTWQYIDKASAIVANTINTVKFTGEYQEIGVKSPVWQSVHEKVDLAIQHCSPDHVRLENHIPDTIEFFADPLIEMVFSNLIDNAKKYGGKISTIRFSFHDSPEEGRILCEDDGVGIPTEEKEKIFDYKYGKNTGLGLFLSREILAITGITISETGIPGKGACFVIACPRETIRESA